MPTTVTITLPSPKQVVAWTGLNKWVRGDDDAGFEGWVTGLVTDAANEVAIVVGEGAFDGQWSPRKAATLARAIGYQSAALALRVPQTERVTGTWQPLLLGSPEELDEVGVSYSAEVRRLINLVTQGAKASAPFSLPGAGSASVAVTGSSRTPTEKNVLWDERNDDSDQDTDSTQPDCL